MIDLTKDLICLGNEIWRVVAAVVASDSPEGHLPSKNVMLFFSISMPYIKPVASPLQNCDGFHNF